MTSKRRLKKEVDYIVSDMVVDCFTYISLSPKPNDDAALKIVQNTLALRNELRHRINHPEQREEGIKVKKYYDNIAVDLLQNLNAGYENLEKLAQSEA